jgi:hypothetical protein
MSSGFQVLGQSLLHLGFIPCVGHATTAPVPRPAVGAALSVPVARGRQRATAAARASSAARQWLSVPRRDSRDGVTSRSANSPVVIE